MLLQIVITFILFNTVKCSLVTGRIAHWLGWQMEPPFALSASFIAKGLDKYATWYFLNISLLEMGSDFVLDSELCLKSDVISNVV